MKLIDKKNFWPTVCVVYTAISATKIILEAIFQKVFGNYQQNLVMILFLSFLGTLVLSQHYRLSHIPLPLVIIGQYALLAGCVMLISRIISFYSEISPGGYLDIFLSFTIPYLIGAILYYVQLWKEVKKINQLLANIKKEDKEHE
ncbi:magnesium-transporting ATPase (P-type) [Anaerotaenia torta]|uniref:DUF6608 family protein n=1 Tax=Anaerotaenia torta TaxID=433293 RepID=UPI003D2349AB